MLKELDQEKLVKDELIALKEELIAEKQRLDEEYDKLEIQKMKRKARYEIIKKTFDRTKDLKVEKFYYSAEEEKYDRFIEDSNKRQQDNLDKIDAIDLIVFNLDGKLNLL